MKQLPNDQSMPNSELIERARFFTSKLSSAANARTLAGRWVLLIVRGSTTTLPFSAFSDYVTFSSRVEMPVLVAGLSS